MKTPPPVPVSKTVRIREGFRVRVAAEQLHTELERVRLDHSGHLLPRDVVVASEPHTAPLHEEFLWDNEEAGDRYRSSQASYLIRSVEYVGPANTPVRMYESMDYARVGPTEVAKVYTRTEDILADPIARENLLARALKELESFKKRYAGLTELSHIFEAMKPKKKRKKR